MTSLDAFLPQHLRELLARGAPARLPCVERFPAALLLSDISGFTALTERLQARGPEGAEEIAAIVSRVFGGVIGAVERHGGSVASFGGDALFSVFPGRDRAADAVAVAQHVRQLLSRGPLRTSAGAVVLRVAQAVHAGVVRGIHLGNGGPDAPRRHYLVAGTAASALARLQSGLPGGALLVSRAAAPAAGAPTLGRPAAARPRVPAATVESYVSIGRDVLDGFAGAYRRATVLFVETRGSAAMPLQRFYQSLCAAEAAYGALLLKSDLSPDGTKWIVVLGIAATHEDDPERGVAMALDLVAGARRGLPLRVGVHSGTVVNVLVGTRSRRSFDVMGDVVNTAARTLARAGWGETLITAPAARLVPGLETEERGRHQVKGKAEPLDLKRCLAVRRLRVERVMAPLVGRDAELRRLAAALGDAARGRGAVFGIGGHPGVGKSALAYEVARRARTMGFLVHEGRALGYAGMAYWAVAEMVRSAIDLPAHAPAETTLSAVAEASRDLGLSDIDRHHVADLLGARYPGSPLEHVKPQDSRQNTLRAIRALLHALALRKPRLLVLEDMQDSDEATRDVVAFLSLLVADAPMLLLLLFRPGYEAPAGSVPIELGELAPGDVDRLLAGRVGASSEEVAALVRARAGGNPLYVEEVVRHLLETGLVSTAHGRCWLARRPRDGDIPERIDAVIGAHLDRLCPPARQILQRAAVIGHSFPVELLASLETAAGRARGARAARGGGAGPNTMPAGVDLALRELTARQLIFPLPRATAARQEYVFKHAMTRDVAYTAILATHRRSLHRSVADGIERLFPAEREQFLPMIAFHREQARQIDAAATAYLAAARAAAAKFALQEAERLYRRCLTLARPRAPERVDAHAELGLKVLYGRRRLSEAEAEARQAIEESRRTDVARQVKARSSLAIILTALGRMEEAEAVYGEALRSSEAIEGSPIHGHLVGNVAIFAHRRGDADAASARYEEAIAIHERSGDIKSAGVAIGNYATLRMDQGRLVDAASLYARALAIHREVGDRGSEGLVLGNLAIARHQEGDTAEALRLATDALAIHREVGQREFEAGVLCSLGNLRKDERRPDDARALYLTALAIFRELGIPRSEAVVLSNLAALHQEARRPEEAMALFVEALRIQKQLGSRREEAISLHSVALLHRDAGRSAGAMDAGGEALRLARDVGDRRTAGQVLCVLGDVHAQLAQVGEARARYAEALEAQRGTGLDKDEGETLLSLAELAILFGGTDAEDLLGQAERIATRLADGSLATRILCARGHLSLARGEDAERYVVNASADAVRTREGAALSRLERAVASRRAGAPLASGYCLEDLTPAQREFVRERSGQGGQ